LAAAGFVGEPVVEMIDRGLDHFVASGEAKALLVWPWKLRLENMKSESSNAATAMTSSRDLRRQPGGDQLAIGA